MIVAPRTGRAFVDTNILIYTVAQDARSETAERTLAKAHVISVQVLNEFANTARRKLAWNTARIRVAESRFLALFELVPLTLELHDQALRVCERYRFGMYDSLIVAASLKAGCDELYSEDLQHGQLIDDQLLIVNPFK